MMAHHILAQSFLLPRGLQPSSAYVGDNNEAMMDLHVGSAMMNRTDNCDTVGSAET